MTKSDVVGVTIEAVLVKSLGLHFEQPLGTEVNSILEQTQFFIVGHYKQNGNPISNQTIYIYQVSLEGVPIDSVGEDITDANGKYELQLTAPDITTDVTLYFQAYDEAGKPM